MIPTRGIGMVPSAPLLSLLDRAATDLRDRRQEVGRGPGPDDRGYRALARFLAGDGATMTDVRRWEGRIDRLKAPGRQGVFIDIAEEFVSRLGLHPSELWPNWHSIAAAVVEEQLGFDFMEEAV